MLHSICQEIWKTQQWPQDWKWSICTPDPKKGNTKECSDYHTTALISQVTRLCSKSFRLSFNSLWTENFQMFKLDFEKTKEPEIKLPTSAGWPRKQEFQKNICFIDYANAFDCVDHTKLWKILKQMGIPDHLTCLLKNLYAGQEAAVRTGHRTQTGSK